MTTFNSLAGHDLSLDNLEKPSATKPIKQSFKNIKETSSALFYLAREYARGNLNEKELPHEHWL